MLSPEEPTFGSKHSSRAKLRRSSISILRPILDERHFEENYQSVERKIKFSVPEPIRSAISPPRNLQQWKQFFFLHVPILHWLLTYKKGYILSDVVAGITIGIMQVAQGLAYALLAEVPPVYGLYTSFLPPILYAVFGASRQLSLGCFTLVCLLVGSGISRVIATDPALQRLCFSEGTTSSLASGMGAAMNLTLDNATDAGTGALSPCDSAKVQLALVIAFMAGLIMILCGIFQLGFITIFFSDALISGYTTAAGFHALTSQLKYIFDFPPIETKASQSPFEVPDTLINTGKLIYDHKTNWNSFLIAAVSFAFLVIIRIVNKKLLPRMKLYKRFPIPIPGAVILVVTATLISRFATFEATYNVTVVGYIPSVPPPPSLPKFEYIPLILQDAFIVAVISFAIGVSLSKMFAKKNKYSISANQEFLAYGIVNLVSCFFSSFSSAGSLSRTTVADNTGGKTQVVGLISASLVLLTLLALGTILKDLPLSVLAAIVMEALITLFSQFKDIRKYFKLSKPDMMVWLVSFGATVLLGIDIGLGIAVAFSLFLIIGRIILPPSASLGRAPNTEIFRNRKDFKKVQSLPGILIFRFVAPLCYVNGLVFRSRLITAAGVDPAVALTEDSENCIKVSCRKVKNRASNVHFSEMVRRSSLSRASSPGSSRQSTHPLTPSVCPGVDHDGHRGSDGWLERKNSGSQQGSHRGSHETGHPQQQSDARSKKNDVNVHENRLQVRKDERPSEVSICSDASDLTPILKNRRSSGVEDEGHGSFTKLSDAMKKKWRRFVGTPTPVQYRRFSDSGSVDESDVGVGSGTEEISNRDRVTITIDPPGNNSSVDSAIPEDPDGSDNITEEPLLTRPHRKRNTDSVDSGDMSDTESQPSMLHLQELDEETRRKPKMEYYNVVSCVADDAELPVQPNLHTIIVDCAPITFMDSVGAEVLEQIIFDYDKIGIQILLARAAKPNRDMLGRSGFFDRFGKEWLFPSLQDAVNHAETGVRLRRYVQKVNKKISIEYENTRRGPRSLSRHRRSLDSGSESGSRGSSGDEETVEPTGKRYWPFRTDRVQFRVGGGSETESLSDVEEEDEEVSNSLELRESRT